MFPAFSGKRKSTIIASCANSAVVIVHEYPVDSNHSGRICACSSLRALTAGGNPTKNPCTIAACVFSVNIDQCFVANSIAFLYLLSLSLAKNVCCVVEKREAETVSIFLAEPSIWKSRGGVVKGVGVMD